MKKHLTIPSDIVAVLAICFAAFSAYHAPQPLFPSIQETFGLSASSATLITTCVILPLGLAPIFYGVALSSLPLRGTLAASLALYGLACLVSAFGGTWELLLAGRLLQGISLPAIIVCAMTYISSQYGGSDMQKYMGLYAMACMIGGFGGRVMAGLVEKLTDDWKFSFVAMAIIVLSTLPFTRMLNPAQGPRKHLDLSAIAALFRQKGMGRMLLIAPCVVLANNSILNVLPFRLRAIDPGISPFTISMVYMGIIICSISGFLAPKLIRLAGSEMKALIIGMLQFMLFIPLLMIPSAPALFLSLIGLNFGYAFMYACLPAIINRFSQAEKSVTNGVFTTSYYLSGAIGSYFPTLIYEHAGYPSYLACMFALAGTATAVAYSMRGITLAGSPAPAKSHNPDR